MKTKADLLNWLVNELSDCGKFTWFTNELTEKSENETQFRAHFKGYTKSNLIEFIFDLNNDGQKFIESNNLN